MLLTKDEIAAIIDNAMLSYLPNVESVRILYMPAVLAASEAIAAQLERPRLIIELLAESGGDAHQVDVCIKAARELMGREEAAC